MKILFYDAKKYDMDSFNRTLPDYPEIEITYQEAYLDQERAALAKGYDAVCAFVSANICRQTVKTLSEVGVKLILMRCAGFNNVDLDAAKEFGVTVMRVPGYSPEAVAEFAMALAMAVNRHIHKSYVRVRENNFTLNGLEGIDLFGKTAGIIGTGRIGAAMCRICNGFGMKVIAFDMYPNKDLDFVTYKSLDEVLRESDLISLHCPATKENHHMINLESIEKMKDGVILVNTSRGMLVDTEDLIQGIRAHKFLGVGLDVYEEEAGNVFEDREDDILDHSIVARLLSFPNVIVTSHQGFLTSEALYEISNTTLKNAMDYQNGTMNPTNVVA